MNNADPQDRKFIRLGGAALIFLLLAGFVLSRFAMTADITHFLPDADDRALAAISRQITDSELSRTLVLALETPDLATSLSAARDFETALRNDPRVSEAVAFLEGGPAEGIDRALFELYEPRRLSFLAATEELARERLEEEGLREAARALREELSGPLSALTSRVAARDPFLTIPTLFRRLENSRANDLTVIEGRFITQDGKTAVLFLGTRASALDARAQAPFLAAIEEDFALVADRSPVPIRLDQSGVHLMATRTAETIEGDIKRVSTVSTLLLIVFLLFLFRSLRFVALATIPVSFGILAGAAFVLILFGRLHAITLAFGAALIGVSIDYVVHLYCHHTIVAPEGGPAASLRAIARPLATGAITTIAGFLALSASTLSGLREIACFSVVGLTAAFIASVGLVPALMSNTNVQVSARTRWVRTVEHGISVLGQHRIALAALPIGALLIVAWGLPGARFNPDLASLGRMDQEILEEDERVRAKVTRFEQMRFVISLGENDARALEVNDAVSRQLDSAIEAGELGAQRSVAALLPSPRTQEAVAAIARSDSGLPERFTRSFEEAGFAKGAFEPFLESLREAPPPPLDFETIAASAAASLVRPFRVQLENQVGILSFLHDVRSPEALAKRLETIPNALFLRQSDLWADAQLQYQESTAKLLTAGLLAVLALLAIRYRDLRRTLASFMPSVLAAAVTVSVLALSGRGLDLISLTALLFVVSMGVDYSVFLVDADDEEDPQAVAAALTGALLAGSSTVIAFGLLALSKHPVLSGLGLTAAVGIASSLLLAPTVLLLLRPSQATLSKSSPARVPK